MMERILVTGATGFIGKNLVRTLIKLNVQEIFRTSQYYTGIKIRQDDGGIPYDIHMDLTNEKSVCEALDIARPTIIFHLAGNSIIKVNEKNPYSIIDTNIKGTQMLLQHAPKGCRFVYASSITVYGTTPISNPNENFVPHPISVYAVSKLAGEGLVNTYTDMGLINGVSLRYCANVGRYSTHGVVHDFIRKLRSNSPVLTLIGAYPGSKKPYIHVDDTIGATIKIGKNKALKGSVNICTGDTINIDQLANTVMEALDIKKPKKWLGEASTWAGDNSIIRADNSLLTSTYDYKFQYPASKSAIYHAVKELNKCEYW